MPPRGRRAAQAVHLTPDDEVVDLTMDEAPKPRRGRKRATASAAQSPAVTDGATPKPKKRTRQSKAASSPRASEQETRTKEDGSTARWRTEPSQAIAARIERALAIGAGAAHRMYLIDTEQLAPVGGPNGGRQRFAVMGTTGNVYDVTIGKHPTCTCPDRAQRSSICKHMLFVMLRVLKRPRNDPLVWQDALLSSEVDQVLGGMSERGCTNLDQSVLATAAARLRYKELTGKVTAEDAAGAAAAEAGPSPTGPRPLEGQSCPICFEDLQPGGEPTSSCATCRNSMHTACFGRWEAQKRKSYQAVTCVYCRAPWEAPTAAAAGSASAKYVNLGSGQAQPSHAELYGQRSVAWRHRWRGGGED